MQREPKRRGPLRIASLRQPSIIDRFLCCYGPRPEYRGTTLLPDDSWRPTAQANTSIEPALHAGHARRMEPALTATILIVDDSLTVRMDLAEAFGSAGFPTRTCESVSQALSALATQAVELVVLDVVLPDGDGVDVLRAVRTGPDPELPILMLSTAAEVQDRVRGLKTGANDYVGKPYEVGYVIAKARQLLQHRVSRTAAPAVLLIDDSPTFRAELSEALTRAGHRVVTAESGEEGLRIAADTRPCAVIVDGVLPGIDGPTVIRRIRMDAALRGLPCILLTGASAATEELRALESGADAFVHKDQDPEIVLAKLSAILRNARASERSAETDSLLGPKRILAIDDSATYRETLADALHDEGYEVVAARSGEEAIELLAVQSVDCILLDLLMPGIGGKETCKRLKDSPAIRDIPIVVLTAVEDKASMLEGLALGADDYIEKSAAFDVLKARVRVQLRRRQFEEEARSVRERLLRSEMETAEARAARQLAETRAELVEELEHKNVALRTLAERYQHANEDLSLAYRELQAAQSQLVQSAKMASLGELVAGVAHEINNPLAFVLSHLSTIRSSLDKVQAEVTLEPATRAAEHWGRARNRLSEVDAGLQRIRDLVIKLRTFSRLDEGEWKAVSIRDCVLSVLTILQHRLNSGTRVETAFGEPDVIECFPGLLNQALLNLIANAIDAIGEKPGLLCVQTGADAGDYRIIVSDTGSGIPLEIRERVFEPFFTTKAVGQGTGLGLPITYSIVKKHGGTLELGDNAGRGTAAIVRLPLPQGAN